MYGDVEEGEKEAKKKKWGFEYEMGQEFWQTDAENKTLAELEWKGCVGLAARVRPVQSSV